MNYGIIKKKEVIVDEITNDTLDKIRELASEKEDEFLEELKIIDKKRVLVKLIQLLNKLLYH